ncbi:hypothetical protein J1605_021108 [Eschrichtius robustus]|uniref:LIM domain only protein 3 n=1 Tax=Eschrichtius robustus TaxID=9764 RepID=A0AB34HKE4_ESCRO|nr:hypothetical protein J1605_021108 [Eschrichtius robustus]
MLMEGGRAERLRRGTSQVRLEWIIVKVHEELQYFHSPDSRGDRGWREFGKEMFDLARPVGREFSLSLKLYALERRHNLAAGSLDCKKVTKSSIQMLSVQPDTKPKGCAGCNRKIKDRYLLKALDKYWHEDCLKCACCDCRLGEVGSTLYTKANLILCRRDYLR